LPFLEKTPRRVSYKQENIDLFERILPPNSKFSLFLTSLSLKFELKVAEWTNISQLLGATIANEEIHIVIKKPRKKVRKI
jgi:hypothetical protein